MNIQTSEESGFESPSGAERTWVGLALAWSLFLLVLMPYWHFESKQESLDHELRVVPTEFAERVAQFVKSNQVGVEKDIPVVEVSPGGDAYLQASMWRWYPVLKLRAGETYRLHVSSTDIPHGLSIMPLDVHFRVLPGYEHVRTITPTTPGAYTLVCNQVCGVGHDVMTGKIIVE